MGAKISTTRASSGKRTKRISASEYEEACWQSLECWILLTWYKCLTEYMKGNDAALVFIPELMSMVENVRKGSREKIKQYCTRLAHIDRFNTVAAVRAAPLCCL